jgi:hypothetical protein
MSFPTNIYTYRNLGGGVVNGLRTYLTATITSTDTTIPVNSTTGFPDGTGYDFINIGTPGIDYETIKYTSVDLTNFYCIGGRNYDSRGAYAHTTGDYVRNALPAEIFNRITETLANVETFVASEGRRGYLVQADTVGVSAYDVVVWNMVGRVTKAQSTIYEELALVCGIALNNIAPDEWGLILKEGLISNSAWNWNPQKRLYLSETAGELSESVPSNTANYILVCGIVKDKYTVDFRVELGSIGAFLG